MLAKALDTSYNDRIQTKVIEEEDWQPLLLEGKASLLRCEERARLSSTFGRAH